MDTPHTELLPSEFDQPYTKKVEKILGIKISDPTLVKQGEYLPTYGPLMLRYFESIEPFRISIETMTWKNGEVREIEKEIPNPPPEFSIFARSLGVSKKKLLNWGKDYPEFQEFLEMCNDIYEEFLVANGLTNKYPGQFTTFVAKNRTTMKDVVTNVNVQTNMKEVLDALERGEDLNS